MHPLTKEFFDSFPLIDTEKVLPRQRYRTFGYPLLANWARLMRVHDMLTDEDSRELFRRCVVFRLLECFLPQGRIYELYPLIGPEAWAQILKTVETVPGAEGDTPVDRAEIWLLKTYDHPACHVEPGDVVLDVGAFTGNSGLYFDDQATPKEGGGEGTIYSFEPHPDSFALLQKNMAGRTGVICVNAACAERTGKGLLRGQGVGARLSQGEGIPITLWTIDDFIEKNGIEKVDFIKMDIEGLEPQALEGARETIRRFHPKLAICLYHLSEHFFSIPEQIASYGVPYDFYLKNGDDTVGIVLFCVPSKEAERVPLPVADDEAAMMKQLGELFLLQSVVPEPAPIEVPVEVQVPQPVFRELSTWECGVQLAKNFHLYSLLRPLYRALRKKNDGSVS